MRHRPKRVAIPNYDGRESVRAARTSRTSGAARSKTLPKKNCDRKVSACGSSCWKSFPLTALSSSRAIGSLRTFERGIGDLMQIRRQHDRGCGISKLRWDSLESFFRGDRTIEPTAILSATSHHDRLGAKTYRQRRLGGRRLPVAITYPLNVLAEFARGGYRRYLGWIVAAPV